MPSPRTRIELYFSSRFETDPRILFTPGRVVLLGEHLDHQGGRVLAMPLALGTWTAWSVRPDRKIVLHALNAKAADTFEAATPTRSGRGWADLARGVFAQLAAEGRRLPGLNLAIFGNLPTGSGLASSAAYVTGILRAVTEATGGQLTPAEAARRVPLVERDWGGVPCGPLDPYAVVAGEAGRVIEIDTAALTHVQHDLPAGVQVTTRDSGVTRRLRDTPYAERRRELAEVLQALQASQPRLLRLLDLDPTAFEAAAGGLEPTLARRARHVVTEGRRVEIGIRALAAGDAEALGRLLDESHTSLAQDFEASTPAIDERVREVRAEPGVLGARLQGAGWGGSLVVLERVPDGMATDD